MEIRHFIKLATLTLSLAFLSLLITASTEAKTTVQNDFSCADVSEIPQLECEALVAFYENTDGPNWSNNTGWLVNNMPCDWYALICNEGHVTEIKLEGPSDNNGNYNHFGLVGDIPEEIGDLTKLEWLNLNFNQLTTIPSQIGNLTNLKVLDTRTK